MEKRKIWQVSAIVAAAALFLTGCSASGGDDATAEDGGATGAAEADIQLDRVDEIADQLPEQYKDRTLEVVTTIGMAPMNFPNPDTGLVEGFNPELAQLVGDVLGTEINLTAVTIDQIPPGIDAARYDVAFANMAMTDERLEVLDFATYYQAGSLLGVAEGNPLGLTGDSICGHSIGVSNGSYQQTTVMPTLDEACAAAGEPAIDMQPYPDQQKAMVAVNSGRIDGVVMDGPVLSYAITQDVGLEIAGNVTENDPLAIGTAKDDGLAEVISAAVNHLMEEGHYEDLLVKYGIEDLGITSSEVHT